GSSKVEWPEPEPGGHHGEVAVDPRGLARRREPELVDQERRRHAEAHHVHQAVELPAEPRPRPGQTRYPAVERVEDAREENVPPGAIELAPRREHHRPDPEKQIEQCEQARHDDHDAPNAPGAGEPPHGVYSASTVAPAWTRSPKTTRTADRD